MAGQGRLAGARLPATHPDRPAPSSRQACCRADCASRVFAETSEFAREDAPETLHGLPRRRHASGHRARALPHRNPGAGTLALARELATSRTSASHFGPGDAHPSRAVRRRTARRSVQLDRGVHDSCACRLRSTGPGGAAYPRRATPPPFQRVPVDRPRTRSASSPERKPSGAAADARERGLCGAAARPAAPWSAQSTSCTRRRLDAEVRRRVRPAVRGLVPASGYRANRWARKLEEPGIGPGHRHRGRPCDDAGHGVAQADVRHRRPPAACTEERPCQLELLSERARDAEASGHMLSVLDGVSQIGQYSVGGARSRRAGGYRGRSCACGHEGGTARS